MTQRPHLLMYGIYYAPEGTGAAPYNTSLSRGLAKRGWDVTVVTGVPHYPSWKREPLGELPEVPGLTVVRRDHFVPAKQSVLTRGLYEASWLATGAATFVPNRAVDVVLGVTPGLSGATLAMTAAARYRKPFVLWAHDLVGQTAQQSGFSGGGKVAGLISGAEIGLAKRADRVVVFADGYTRYFASNGVDESKIFRVRHWVHGAEAEAAVDAPSHRAAVRARLGWKDDEVIVLHGGNMGFKQGLDNVLETAALAKGRADLRFVLLGDGNQRKHLGDRAAELGLTNLTFEPVAPQDEFQRVLAAADVLILNLRGSVEDMALPCKLTSYFTAGVPVVAAVSRTSEAAAEVGLAGAGLSVVPDDPAALLEGIVRIVDSPEHGKGIGRAGRAFAADNMSEERVIERFDGILRGVLPSRA